MHLDGVGPVFEVVGLADGLPGQFALLADKGEADLILLGEITGYQMQELGYDAFGKPREKRLRITASVKLIDVKRDRLVFFEREIQSFKIYSDTVFPVMTGREAEEWVLDDLSRRISLKTITGWYTEAMTGVEKGNKPGK